MVLERVGKVYCCALVEICGMGGDGGGSGICGGRTWSLRIAAGCKAARKHCWKERWCNASPWGEVVVCWRFILGAAPASY